MWWGRKERGVLFTPAVSSALQASRVVPDLPDSRLQITGLYSIQYTI
jgi:hypothetical protein